ncbi:MAG: hypothetical protein QM638_08710 [Nocardioides sp.]|uniref:hypothetical protein n=1 Tax=Nocardioides sp. TaxID=35761 RepID=UPI0039E2431C
MRHPAKKTARALTSVVALALAASLAALTAPAGAVTVTTAVRSHGHDYRLTGSPITIRRATDYTLRVRTGGARDLPRKADATTWFVTADGTPAFTNTRGVATATGRGSTLTVTVHAARIQGFAGNGSAALYLAAPDAHPIRVGRWIIPTLTVSSDLYGSAYTYGKSTLKEHFGGAVTFDPSTDAALKLTLPGLDNSKIGGRTAVALASGDGYYPSEYDLSSTALGAWSKGSSTYTLETGDLTLDTGDYPILDTDSGREWSCLGGDGQGHYTFNLAVSGITYNGLPVASRTFPLHVYVYGYNYTSDAETLYGDGTAVTADFAPLREKVADPPTPGTRPIWTWVGDGSEPNLVDAKADDFYVTWPRGVNASALTAADVRITLHGRQGDALTLKPGTDYRVHQNSAGESQIALTYQNWAFEPVYDSMSVTVSAKHLRHASGLVATDLSASYDISSVYVYEAQQGGGGTTVDGTVTAYSFYGLRNLTSWRQLMSPATYTLKTTVDGTDEYYAADSSGTATLVTDPSAAMSYDGSGAADRNQRLIGNTLYVTTRLDQTVSRTVAGRDLSFTKVYSGGGLLNPTTADQGLSATAGYAIPSGTTNWITHEKWAWQSSIASGWTGIDIEPYTGKFEWSLAKGGTQQFTADDPSVTWSLVGAESTSTTISADGLLTVGADETASSVAVVATSTTDHTAEGKGTVNVDIE